jgi:hypothetical protein
MNIYRAASSSGWCRYHRWSRTALLDPGAAERTRPGIEGLPHPADRLGLPAATALVAAVVIPYRDDLTIRQRATPARPSGHRLPSAGSTCDNTSDTRHPPVQSVAGLD